MLIHDLPPQRCCRNTLRCNLRVAKRASASNPRYREADPFLKLSRGLMQSAAGQDVYVVNSAVSPLDYSNIRWPV